MRRKGMRRNLIPYLLLVPQITLTLLFIIGLIIGTTQGLGVIPASGLREPTLRYYRKVLTRPDILKSVLYSLKVAFPSAGVATAVGVSLSAVRAMRKRTKGSMMRVIQPPIIVLRVVVAIFMVNIFSQSGLLARTGYAPEVTRGQQRFPMLTYGTEGMGIILAYLRREISFIIYFVIILVANINEKLGEAAINLGAGQWTASCKITLPLCKDVVISGLLIIFVFALDAYELPFLLGTTSSKALPVLTYQQYIHSGLRNRPYSMVLNGIIIILPVFSTWMYYFIIRKNMKALTEQ